MMDGVYISTLARQHGLSRTALLYYSKLGLLKPSMRSGSGYRLYSFGDAERLKQICLYRKMGIPLKDIARMLRHDAEAGPSEVLLRRRLQTLETEIELLQEQQQLVLRLLEQLNKRNSATNRGKQFRHPRALAAGKRQCGFHSKENDMVSKHRWVEIMTAAGFSEADRKKWHQTFEKMEPQAHQEFLESLGIDGQEISRIREWSRK